MPSRRDGRIEPGQPLKSAISASAWNRAQDAADIVLGQRPGFAAESSQALGRPYTSILCRNSSGADVGRWAVLQISSLSISPDDDDGPRTSQFQQQPIIVGTTPTSTTYDKFCVTVEPIKAGSIGRVAIDGVVQVKLDIRNQNDLSAGAKPGTTEELVTGDGPCTILWNGGISGPGNWGLVRLGGGRTIKLGTVSTTWQKGGVKTVTEIRGFGDERAGNPTFEARNWFATVNVFATPKKVACALLDNTWVLIAAEC